MCTWDSWRPWAKIFLGSGVTSVGFRSLFYNFVFHKLLRKFPIVLWNLFSNCEMEVSRTYEKAFFNHGKVMPATDPSEEYVAFLLNSSSTSFFLWGWRGHLPLLRGYTWLLRDQSWQCSRGQASLLYHHFLNVLTLVPGRGLCSWFPFPEIYFSLTWLLLWETHHLQFQLKFYLRTSPLIGLDQSSQCVLAQAGQHASVR